jgi:paired amphipathic helix protein Sin3a
LIDGIESFCYSCANTSDRTLTGEDTSGVRTDGDLGVRVSLGTYKLFYEGGSGECIYREREQDEVDALVERARAREEDRRRAMTRWA